MAGQGQGTPIEVEIRALRAEIERLRSDLRNPVRLSEALTDLLREADQDRIVPPQITSGT